MTARDAYLIVYLMAYLYPFHPASVGSVFRVFLFTFRRFSSAIAVYLIENTLHGGHTLAVLIFLNLVFGF